MGVGEGLAELGTPAKGHPGGFRRIAIDRGQGRNRRLAKLHRIDGADVGACAPRVHPVDAIGGEALPQEQGEPALAPIGRRVIDPRRMTAAGIEQDGIGIFLLRRILVSRIDMIDHDLAARPARAVGIAAIVRFAGDELAARLHAALPRDLQGRLGPCGRQ